MYRIELSPGEETAFRSIEELAVAIKRGFVTSRARIWHNASSKWLPIEFHPHYKIAASMQLTAADLVAGPPVQKLELLTLGEQMAPSKPVKALELLTLGDRMDPAPPVRPAVPGQPPRAKRPPEPEQKARTKATAKPIAAAKPASKVTAKSRRPKSGRRSIRIALAGALLIAGAHLVVSGVSAARTEATAILPRTHRRLIMTPMNSAQQGRPETTAAAVLPRLPTGPRPGILPGTPARPAPSASLATESATRPSLESRSEAATPPLGAFRAESDTGIQPAPTSIDIAAPVPQNGDSLAKKLIDSSGKKTLKRILRIISGTPAAEQTRSKR
jgi:hypothetical protein